MNDQDEVYRRHRFPSAPPQNEQHQLPQTSMIDTCMVQAPVENLAAAAQPQIYDEENLQAAMMLSMGPQP